MTAHLASLLAALARLPYSPRGARRIDATPSAGCNFCHTKAKNVRSAAAHAVQHGGRVPQSYDALLAMPGVGPKIAHLMRSGIHAAGLKPADQPPHALLLAPCGRVL